MHHTTGCNPLQQIHQNGLEPVAIMASNFEMLCFLALVYLWAIHLNRTVNLPEYHEIRNIVLGGALKKLLYIVHYLCKISLIII